MVKVSFMLILAIALATAAAKTISEDRSDYCGSCGGAKSGCCNTCNDIKQAYSDKNWQMPAWVSIAAAQGREAKFLPGEWTWEQCQPKCTFVKGASTRMRKEYLGTVKNRLECVLLVKGTRPTASGVTFKPSGKKCWAEFGTTGRTTESNYETCKFDLEGDESAVDKWFTCCSLARKNNDWQAANVFKPGYSWGSMPAADQTKWDSNGCNAIVGGINKPACMIDPDNLDKCGDGSKVCNDGKSGRDEKVCKGQDENGDFQQENSWYVDCCVWRQYWNTVAYGPGKHYACASKDDAVL